MCTRVQNALQAFGAHQGALVMHRGDKLQERAEAKSLVTPAYRIDPLADPRWVEFVERHPRASVFHTPGWLEALRRTYGYEPVAYTTTPPGVELANGVVLCRVSSRITGRRMVSLPFSDHCEPLVESLEDRKELFSYLRRAVESEHWKYVEIRPISSPVDSDTDFGKTVAYCLHTLDLRPQLDEIFRTLHKSSCQDRI